MKVVGKKTKEEEEEEEEEHAQKKIHPIIDMIGMKSNYCIEMEIPFIYFFVVFVWIVHYDGHEQMKAMTQNSRQNISNPSVRTFS